MPCAPPQEPGDADAHLDSVRKALESEAPAVLRRMPVADGVNSRRRSKATAAAEGQLSRSTRSRRRRPGPLPLRRCLTSSRIWNRLLIW